MGKSRITDLPPARGEWGMTVLTANQILLNERTLRWEKPNQCYCELHAHHTSAHLRYTHAINSCFRYVKAKQLRPDACLCVCPTLVKVPGVPHRVCHEPCTELPGEGEAVSVLPAVGGQQLQLQIGKCRQKPCSLCLWQCQLSEMIRSYHKYHCFKAIPALGLLHSASHSHWSPL